MKSQLSVKVLRSLLSTLGQVDALLKRRRRVFLLILLCGFLVCSYYINTHSYISSGLKDQGFVKDQGTRWLGTQQAEESGYTVLTHRPSDVPLPRQHLTPSNFTCLQPLDLTSWRQGVVTMAKPWIKRDCLKLRNNDPTEVKRVQHELKEWQGTESEEQLREKLSNCSFVIQQLSNNFYTSEEERQFPLAFSFVYHSNIQQIWRLLRVIYRPHNMYCFHPDAKAGEAVVGAFKKVSQCVDNVFVASKLFNITYAYHTLMDAELSCMEDLLNYPESRWRFAINICGTELPLKTNREMVRALKALKGTSAVRVEYRLTGGYFWNERFLWEFVLEGNKTHYTNKKLPHPPIPIYKGAHFVAITRDFISFILHNAKAISLREYLNKVFVPEEEFFASLYMLPEAPGGHSNLIPNVAEIVWLYPGYPRRPCAGKIIRGVCILSAGDLHLVFSLGVNVQKPQAPFFFNKYNIREDHVVMECMEEWLVERNKLEYMSDCKGS